MTGRDPKGGDGTVAAGETSASEVSAPPQRVRRQSRNAISTSQQVSCLAARRAIESINAVSIPKASGTLVEPANPRGFLPTGRGQATLLLARAEPQLPAGAWAGANGLSVGFHVVGVSWLQLAAIGSPIVGRLISLSSCILVRVARFEWAPIWVGFLSGSHFGAFGL